MYIFIVGVRRCPGLARLENFFELRHLDITRQEAAALSTDKWGEDSMISIQNLKMIYCSGAFTNKQEINILFKKLFIVLV